MIFLLSITIATGIFFLATFAYGYVNRVAYICYRCKGSGEYKRDPLFDCEECKGTGLLICEAYSPNWPGTVWVKPLWFRRKTKKMLDHIK